MKGSNMKCGNCFREEFDPKKDKWGEIFVKEYIDGKCVVWRLVMCPHCYKEYIDDPELLAGSQVLSVDAQ